MVSLEVIVPRVRISSPTIVRKSWPQKPLSMRTEQKFPFPYARSSPPSVTPPDVPPDRPRRAFRTVYSNLSGLAAKDLELSERNLQVLLAMGRTIRGATDPPHMCICWPWTGFPQERPRADGGAPIATRLVARARALRLRASPVTLRDIRRLRSWRHNDDASRIAVVRLFGCGFGAVGSVTTAAPPCARRPIAGGRSTRPGAAMISKQAGSI